MKYRASATYARTNDNDLEKRMIVEKRKQAGISFPAPRKQDHLLIVRLDISSTSDKKLVRNGIKKLCTFFQQIDDKILEIEDTSHEDEFYLHPLTEFNFTATVGFGKTFFRKLDLMKKCPTNLYEIPSYHELGDKSPYVLPQTDMILQLASNNYTLNKMVLQNDSYFRSRDTLTKKDQYSTPILESRSLDVVGAIEGWSKISDIHYGFHRADGRNLMGFYDGISNPHRLNSDIIWIPEDEGSGELSNGTYMVFQKIEHNLSKWNKLETQEQEKWFGRSKATGLLLGTLTSDEEKMLVSQLHSVDSSRMKRAKTRLSQLIDEQRDPTKNFFDPYDTRYSNINKRCPISSHARIVNPRDPNKTEQRYIFRRGYLYMQEEFRDYPKSGLLFISFQKDIKIFEEMKKNMAKSVARIEKIEYPPDLQNYSPQGTLKNSFDTLTLGGGYYFIPPIPNKTISEIGQQFF